MSEFRQFRDGNSIVIHGDSLSLPGDLEFFREPTGKDSPPDGDNLRIFANEVTIDDTCKACADVNITCRVLKLGDGAAFDLSAPENTHTHKHKEPALQFSRGTPGRHGEPGFDAGNLSILCGKVVKVGQLSQSSSEPVEALVSRPNFLQDAVHEHLGELTILDGSSLKPVGPAWLFVTAVGGKGAKGQDGQKGGKGADGKDGKNHSGTVDAGKFKEKNDYRKRKRYDIIGEWQGKSKGRSGGRGLRGGPAGRGGLGGDGGHVRFAVADGAYVAQGADTPEDEWEKSVFMYTTHLVEGTGGDPGARGQGGDGGKKGEPGRFDITIKWEWTGGTVFDKKHFEEGQEGKGQGGSHGHAGYLGASSSRGPGGDPGSDPRSGELFERSLLAKMLDVDHLLKLERAAGEVRTVCDPCQCAEQIRA